MCISCFSPCQEPLSLCLAVQSGDVEAVKKLLVGMEGGIGGEDGGAHLGGDRERAVDQRNEQSHAPLHLACTSGSVPIWPEAVHCSVQHYSMCFKHYRVLHDVYL